MAVTELAEKALETLNPAKKKIPADVERKIKRGRERLNQVSPRRKLAVQFANDDHYGVLSEDGLKITKQSTVAVSMGGTKPDHRVRLSRPLLSPAIKSKVAAATQRQPAYECNPSTNDPEDISAAKLSNKIATAGYELWDLKRARKKLVWNALVTEEGFAAAYWDSTVGPYVEIAKQDPETGEPVLDAEGNPETETVGMGEVRIEIYSGLEVGWEPGVDFEKSRYYFITHARPIEEVEAEPEFEGGKLKPDANADSITGEKGAAGTNMVLVTEYGERPCPKYPKGRRLFSANDRQIFPEEDYPLQNAQGEVVDEQFLRRLSWDVDSASDRDKGLVSKLIDIQREFNHAGNKIDEWLNLAGIAQWTVEEGALSQNTPITDEPGAVIEYKPMMPGQKPPERVRIDPPPQELFQIQDRAQQLMSLVAHDGNVPNQIQAFYEQAQMAEQDFFSDLAKVDSRLMRDCLTLVQLHYTEERMMTFRGRTGWDRVQDFKGADLRNQTDVRVPPDSLTPRTRSSVEQRIMNIAQMFPGYFPPEVILSALEGGTAEGLIQGYEEDVARANEIIGQIRAGNFYEQPPRPVFPGEEAPVVTNEATGELEMATEMPGWMPRPHIDNVSVWKAVFSNFMKSDEWNHLEADAKSASMSVFAALLDIEQKEAMRSASLQNEQAEQLGMANAASGGQPKPMPSLPALNGGSETSPGGQTA